MAKLQRKTLFIFLLLALLTILLGFATNVLSEDFDKWCIENFGAGYKPWLFGLLIAGTLVALYFTTDIGKNLFSPSQKFRTGFNIPVSSESRNTLINAKAAIGEAAPELALDILSRLSSKSLETEILTLKNRLQKHQRNSREGTQTFEQETTAQNRISRDILQLVTALERELESNTSNYREIRDFLKKRYRQRKDQKLANEPNNNSKKTTGDQLFNLNVQYTTEGTSSEKAAAYITLHGQKTGEEIRQIFEQARRRLLVTGVPGSGKTSLLLHLAIELLETDHENLTAVLNLATWRSDFQTLGDWLREILPAELGVTKRYAADLLQQGKLTLLLDGLDEVDEAHRVSCLDAIKSYGGKKQKDFVISTRKDEYKALEKDAPVWAQIEVLPLTKTQLLAQLDHADRRDFPEAPDLKAALENDPLLLKVAETPFYLNCLQLLFRGGSKLSEMNFKGETVEARQVEIVERFTEQALAIRSPRGYTPEQVRHWLSFFASRLTQRNKVVFELVDLQYDWWRWGKLFQLTSKWFGFSILKGIEAGIICIIVIYPVILLMALLLFGLSQTIEKDVVGLLVKSFIPIFRVGFVIGFLSSILRLIFLQSKNQLIVFTKGKVEVSWKFASIVLKYIAIFFSLGLFLGLWDIGLGVNQRKFFLAWIILSATTGFIVGLVSALNKNHKFLLQITTPYQRFIASAKALHFSILQHWLLRWQLYRAGVLPLRLVDFLNEMTARHLLETDGATWRFRHRILQEYFTSQWQA